MKTRIALTISLFLCLGTTKVLCQELPLVTDKPGTFQILSRTDYTESYCGFTNAEITANLQRITDVVNAVRKNPVLSDIKGFEGRARIYEVGCKDARGYGIPSRISFEFCSWYRQQDGSVVRGTIEPPEWSLYINTVKPVSSDFFDQKNGYFTVPLRKKIVEPGIDVYDGECFVIYDSSRPPYWIPVTVDEAFQAIREFYKNQPDDIGKDMAVKMIEKEYTAIPGSDRDKHAYFGGNLSRISSTPGIPDQDSIFPCIVKVNPEYWNKALPKSAIQLIYFRSVQNKDYLRRLKEEWLKANSISYNEMRFEESFDLDDIRNLVPLIGK